MIAFETEAFRPELLASVTASLADEILMTGATGPKVSSCAISMSVVTPVRTVGG